MDGMLVDDFAGERRGESHSIRILEESPPREEDCPVMLARWYVCRPPEVSIWARRDAAWTTSLEARACVSCFWRVWWVRIRVRVAWEEREVGGFWVGGRELERSLGFLDPFFLFEAMMRSNIDGILSQLELTGWFGNQPMFIMLEVWSRSLV